MVALRAWQSSMAALLNKEKYKTIIRASKNIYSNMISTNEQTYMLMMQRKPTATELLKALHNAWFLGPSLNNGNGNSGDDDADNGEPTDVALTQPGGFTKGFSKNCFKCGKKGHMAKDGQGLHFSWRRQQQQW